MRLLYDDPAIELLSFDVYRSPYVQFVADAHKIPLPDGTFDGVIVQAVLEHVLEPTVVVAEIYRVLRSGGLLYAETPFLQPVHGGPYDFTRFTESGHRYLFRAFERLDSGPLNAAGTTLLLSIDYFVRSLFRSRAAGKAAKLALILAATYGPADARRSAVDAASGTYFLGRRADIKIGPHDIIRHYLGSDSAVQP